MSYSSVILADSPLAYYRMDAPSGTSETDQTGNGHTGTYSQGSAGGFTLAQAGATLNDVDKAVTFASAQTGRLTLDALGALGAGLATSSFEFLLKTTNTSAIETVFGTANSGGTFPMNVACRLNAGISGSLLANRMRLDISGATGTGGNWVVDTSTTPLQDGGWHHVVWTLSGTATSCTITCYVDGISQTLSTLQSNPFNFGSFTNFGQAMTVAAYNFQGSVSTYLDGTVDEVAFYPTALSSGKVTAHYQAARYYTDAVAGSATVSGTVAESFASGISTAGWAGAANLFAANVYTTTLVGSILSTDLSCTVQDTPPGTPTVPFYATLDRGTGSTEIIQVTAVGGTGNTTWTIVRARSGTSPASHSSSASVFTNLSLAVGFTGGDTNASIDLGSGRVLWAFNDPMWATAAGQARTSFPNMHQILAIQNGYDLSTATLTWYPAVATNGKPASFFPDYADSDGTPNYIWFGTGIMLDGKLILVGVKRSGSAGMANGSWAAMVDNPSAAPSSWNWFQIPIWTQQITMTDGGSNPTGQPGFGFGSLADPGDGYLYMWATGPTRVASRGTPWNQMFIARVFRSDAVAGNLSNPQWWCGATLGWSFERGGKARAVKQPVAPLNTTFLVQATQHARSDGNWQMTGSDDSGHLQYALRSNQSGTFPALQSIYAIPNVQQGINYTAYAHPEQTWPGKAANDVLMTYTPGLPSAGISTTPETYLPKFVQTRGL